MINKLVFYSTFIFLLFSCVPEGVQENNIIEDAITNDRVKTQHNELNTENIIAVYSKENQLEIWENNSGEIILKKTMNIDEANLPLGIQKIKSIDDKQVLFHYFKSNKYPIDSIIHINNNSLANIDNLDNYTLIVVPSRPNEYGIFEGCFQCPHWNREMALQSKLEWESIFGNFQNIH
ncbi:MAG: hypothetical protein ACI94Y_003110 [Maribacter sp.]|jgi:hypothetical protein